MGDIFDAAAARLDDLRAVRFPHVTDDRQWRYILEECRKGGIDPSTIAVKLEPGWDDDDWVEPKIIVTQQAIRGIADRTGKKAGETPPQWCGPDGVWKDVWTEAAPPFAARATVVRRDYDMPFEAIAYYRQCANYVVDKKTGARVLTKGWRDGGAPMLGKCAIVAAHRAAFHNEIGQLMSREENDPQSLPKYSRRGEPADMALADGGSPGEPSTPLEPPDDPKYAYRLVDDTTPDSRKGLILALMHQHDLSPAAKAESVVERFKQKMPLTYNGHFQAFAAVVLKWVGGRPAAYA